MKQVLHKRSDPLHWFNGLFASAFVVSNAFPHILQVVVAITFTPQIHLAGLFPSVHSSFCAELFCARTYASQSLIVTPPRKCTQAIHTLHIGRHRRSSISPNLHDSHKDSLFITIFIPPFAQNHSSAKFFFTILMMASSFP